MMKLTTLLATVALSTAAFAEPMTITVRSGPTTGVGYVDGAIGVSRFGTPSGLAVDSDGNVFVADDTLQTIRKITPAGETSTVAGMAGVSGGTDGRGAAARFSAPVRIAIDLDRNLYVLDNTSRVRKISPQGVVTTLVANLPHIGMSITVDAAGTIYAGCFDKRVYKITPGGSVSIFATLDAVPRALAVDANGALYAGVATTIQRVFANGTATNIATLEGDIGGLSIDASGNFFAAIYNTAKIWKVTSNGTASLFAGNFPGSGDGSALGAQFQYPYDVAVAPGGVVYVADKFNYSVRKIAQAQVTTIGGSAKQCRTVNGLQSATRYLLPKDIAGASNGTLYVAETRSIRKLTPEGTTSLWVGDPVASGNNDGSGLNARFDEIDGMAIDAQGNLYAAELWTSTIRKITPAGVVSTFAGTANILGSTDATGGAASFNHPRDLVVDSAGNLFVADSGNSTIRKITPARVVTTFAGAPMLTGDTDATGTAARFRRPMGIAIDPADNIYVSDIEAHTIRKITPAGVVTTIAGFAGQYGYADGTGTNARFSTPTRLEYHNGLIYVLDSSNFNLRAVTPEGVVTTIGGVERVEGNQEGTGAIALTPNWGGFGKDAAGNLVLADRNHCNVRDLRAPGIADLAIASTPSPAINTVVQLGTDGNNATSWTWTILRRPAGSVAQLSAINTREPTFTPDVADTFVLQLRAQGAAGVRYSTVNVTPVDACPAIASVVATVAGSADVCVGGAGNVATVAITGGESPTVQWGVRMTPGGATMPIPMANGFSHTIRGSDLGHAGTFYLVATVTTSCGVKASSNPITVHVTETPSSAITASTSVNANTTHNFASVVDAGDGATYAWSITNGTITAGAGTRSIRYTAGASGPITLLVTVGRNGCESTTATQVAVYLPPGEAATAFYMITPCRIVDSRDTNALANNATRVVNAGGVCGVPPGAKAIAVNLTAVNPASSGFLSLYATDNPWPGTSTMSYRTNKTRANNAVLRIAPDGTLTVLNSGVAVHFLIDVTGYFY